MPEVKTLTPGKQLANAVAAIAAANEEAKRQLDEQAAAAIRQLEEAAAARASIANSAGGAGLIDRAQHVFVGHFDPRAHGGHLDRFFDTLDVTSPITNYRISMSSHYQNYSGERLLPGPRDCSYRVWLLFEPLPDEAKPISKGGR